MLLRTALIILLSLIPALAALAEEPSGPRIAKKLRLLEEQRLTLSVDELARFDDSAVQIEIYSAGLKDRLSELRDRGPVEKEGWRLVQDGKPLATETLASRMGRLRELEQYPHETGPEMLIVGLSTMGAGVVSLIAGGFVSLLGGDTWHFPAYGGGVGIAVGGVVSLVGYFVHDSSPRRVPLAAAAELVYDHNTELRASIKPVVEVATTQAAPRAIGFEFIDSDGLRISQVDPTGPAHGLVNVGDLLLAIGERAVLTPEAFEKAVADARTTGALKLTLMRKSEIRSVTITK